MTQASSCMQFLDSDDHSCHGGYCIASRKLHIGSRPSHLSPRSIASVALGQHQYSDSICQVAINEPPNRRKAKELPTCSCTCGSHRAFPEYRRFTASVEAEWHIGFLLGLGSVREIAGLHCQRHWRHCGRVRLHLTPHYRVPGRY